MAITEATKRLVFQQREQIRQRIEKRQADIENLLAQVETFKAANVADKKAYDALKKDVAEPTPPPEPNDTA